MSDSSKQLALDERRVYDGGGWMIRPRIRRQYRQSSAPKILPHGSQLCANRMHVALWLEA